MLVTKFENIFCNQYSINTILYTDGHQQRTGIYWNGIKRR